MKDQTGQTVMSALNEEMCRQVAEAGGGAYIHVENNSKAQDQLDNELDKLAKKEIESNVYSDYDEQFQAVGILVILLLVLEICILEVRNPLLRRLSLFKRTKTAAIILLLLVFSASVQAQNARQLVRQGNRHFRQGNVASAEVAYRKALEKDSRNPQAAYNLGNAMMMQRKDSTALSQLTQAARLETNPLRRAQAYHNIGVIAQQNRQYAEAIEAYKEALRNNPTDDETRYNLELCKRQQQQQQQKPKDNQQNQDKKDNQDNQDKKDKKDKQDKKDQQKKQQQPKQQMSKENAEQLLNAAIEDEKNTQERLKKAMQQPQRRRHEKNW